VADHTNARLTFARAIERGNLVVAEITAQELGRLDLTDADRSDSADRVT
jgi:hypothetical protein